MIRSTAVACAVLLLSATSATAQWRTLQSPDREVTERFDLGGAAQALDSLRCGADRRAPE